MFVSQQISPQIYIISAFRQYSPTQIFIGIRPNAFKDLSLLILIDMLRINRLTNIFLEFYRTATLFFETFADGFAQHRIIHFFAEYIRNICACGAYAINTRASGLGFRALQLPSLQRHIV